VITTTLLSHSQPGSLVIEPASHFSMCCIFSKQAEHATYLADSVFFFLEKHALTETLVSFKFPFSSFLFNLQT